MYEILIFCLFGNYLFLSGSLFSSSGIDVVSYSELGFFDGIVFNEFFSYRDDVGISERWI